MEKDFSWFFGLRTLYFNNNKTQKKIDLLAFSSPLNLQIVDCVMHLQYAVLIL